MAHERKWWKEGETPCLYYSLSTLCLISTEPYQPLPATVYQVYPSSFLDTNGDGIGDLPGITSKLDHIASLGASCLWLSPHYASPQIDNGYDISSFEAVHAPYGTLAQCQTLIDETHKRGMRIIFDLVINHVSDQHEWFKESRSSKKNPKRDWFFWKPARHDAQGNRSAPNNWRSQFSVPAWTWDETTQEYYLHLYASQMPDLNWENADCRRAIYDSAVRFWLARGIDGFRIDTVNKYSKDVSFPDAAVTDLTQYTQPAMQHYSNGLRMREFLLEMNDVFTSYSHGPDEFMTVGELPNTPLETSVLAYVSAAARQLNMVFNFDVVSLGQTHGNRLRPAPFRTADVTRELSRWQCFVRGTDAWTTVFLENHDQGRSISRFGAGDKDGEMLRFRSGKALAVVLATMTGTLFLYQGQEIGMVNAPRSWPASEYKDIRSVNFYAEVMERSGGDSAALEAALAGMQKLARDNARLPMQWSAAPNAGFCDEGVLPWMRVHDDYRKTCNVEAQEGKEGSLLEFWKQLLGMRNGAYKDLWVYGDFSRVGGEELVLSDGGSEQEVQSDVEDEDVFVFLKTAPSLSSANIIDNGVRELFPTPRVSITIVNLSATSRPCSTTAVAALVRKHSVDMEDLRCVVGNVEVREREEGRLLAWEGRVYVG